VFAAGWTLFLIVAGALVTSNDAGLSVPDWPLSYGSWMPPMVGGIFYEHGHRMIASVAGLLTIVLAVWLWRTEQRRWVKMLGAAALGSVIVQGVLGGLTVLFLLPAPVSVSHACLAQLYFCMMVSLALVTSPRWQAQNARRGGGLDEGSPSLRHLCIAVNSAIFLQLALGAAFTRDGSRTTAVIVEPHASAAPLHAATRCQRASPKRLMATPRRESSVVPCRRRGRGPSRREVPPGRQPDRPRRHRN
jgi:cytochrome c oxidase assembly protein subunit 15